MYENITMKPLGTINTTNKKIKEENLPAEAGASISIFTCHKIGLFFLFF
jgi:hypothetical protein